MHYLWHAWHAVDGLAGLPLTPHRTHASCKLAATHGVVLRKQTAQVRPLGLYPEACTTVALHSWWKLHSMVGQATSPPDATSSHGPRRADVGGSL